MTIEQLRKVHAAKPFQPFIMHLADGRQLSVESPELIMPAPTGRTVVVWHEDAFDIIDLLLVTDLEVKTNGSRKGRRRQ